MHNADGRDGMDETRLNAVQYMVVFMLLASGQIGYLEGHETTLARDKEV